MAEVKISELTSATTPLAGTEVVPIVQGGVTKKVAVSNLGGSAAWGGITGTLSNQTDLNSALSGKQDTLVSGTNIKTINSTSLLGSGNVAVQPTLVSGTNIKTINGSSVLGSGDLVVGGGGGLFIPIKPVSGSWYSNTILSENQTTYSIPNSNAMFITPFVGNNTITISDVSIYCNGTDATQEAKIFIYSDSNGKPLTQLALSSGLSLATSGLKTFTLPSNLTLTAGTTYWIGLIYKSFGVGSIYGNDGTKGISIVSDNSTGTPVNTYVYPISYASVPSTITQASLIALNYSNVARINFKSI